jgi:eukaryotic-like serine/threonine-protein kinase
MDEAQIRLLPINEAVRESAVLLAQNYSIEKYSDKGANGYVFFGEDILGRKVAVKYYYWAGEKVYHAEPKRLSEFKSPHIAPVLNAGLADGEWAYFITPYYDEGDLDDLLHKRVPPLHAAIRIIEDVLDGLSHLHSARLVHRDIKCANVFIEKDRTAVIGDFGSVRRIPEAMDSVPASGMTIVCWPPETCESQTYGQSGDIYQVGLLLYRLCGGVLPTDSGYALLNAAERRAFALLSHSADQSIFIDEVIRKRILQNRLCDYRTLAPWVSARVCRVLSRAMHNDPERRYRTATEFLQNLQRLRAEAPDWASQEDGTLLCSCGKATRRVRRLPDGSYRAEKPWGARWQRDGSVEQGDISEVCRQVDLTLS